MQSGCTLSLRSVVAVPLVASQTHPYLAAALILLWSSNPEWWYWPVECFLLLLEGWALASLAIWYRR